MLHTFYSVLFVGTIVSACGVVFLRKTIYCALSLVATMLCLAGIFLLIHAPFVALIQVLVYAGAVMVLFLYVIMLLNPRHQEPLVSTVIERRFWAVLLFVVFFFPATIIWLWRVISSPEKGGTWETVPVREIAARLLGYQEILLPFELTSVLLLVAIVGAILIAKRN